MPPFNFALLTNPAFWIGILHSAAVATEKASPDFTVGHHIAAVLDGILGHAPISTPNKAAEESIPQAVIDGVKASF